MAPPDRRYYFRVSDFVGEVITDDEGFLADVRRLYYEQAEPTLNPHVSFRISVDRSLNLNKIHTIKGIRGLELTLITAFYPSLLPALDHHTNRVLIKTLQPYCLIQGGFTAFQGKGLLLVGGPETGRPLLVRALTERGWTYYGDGMVILNMPGREAFHFPKSIALQRPANPLTRFREGEKTFRDPERTSAFYVLPDNRAQTWREVHPVHSIAFTSRQDGDGPELKAVSRADALLRLMENAYDQGDDDGLRFAYLAGLVRETDCFRVNIKGLKKTTDLIIGRIAASI